MGGMARTRSIFSEQYDQAVIACRDGWRVLLLRGPSQIQFWFIALAIGIAAGFAALFFRKGIEALEAFLYQADGTETIHTAAAALPWYVLLTIPALGGLIVGVILHRFTPDGRVRSVADVIEGAALREGRVETRAGLASAAASLSAKRMRTAVAPTSTVAISPIVSVVVVALLVAPVPVTCWMRM